MRPNKLTFSRKLGILSASMLLIFCVIVIVQAAWTHDVALKRGQLIAERLTKIEADHIELTFSSVNLTLKGEAQRFYYNSLFGKPSYEILENEFRNWIAETPQAAWILISDADGNVPIMGSKADYQLKGNEKKNIANENYFQYQKKNSPRIDSKQDLSITIRHAENEKGNGLIILSRPIYNFDGNFSGVIAVAIDPDYFFNLFRSIELGSKVGIGIIINNGQVTLSEGNKPNIDLLAVSGSDNKLANLKPGEMATLAKNINNTDYIVTFKKLGTMPAVVALMFDRNEILAGWRSERMTDLVFLVLFTVFGGVLFSLILAMAKQVQRSEDSEKKALLANQAKTEFFAKMSHELRTPLNAIIGFSEMMDNGYFGPLNNQKQQERIHDINLCGNHLLQLINDILDYSKGEAGKLEIRETEISLSKVVDDSVRMIREKAKNKEISISMNVPGNLPKVLADEKKVKQILLNLLSNAVKFTKENGKIKIEAVVIKSGEMEVTVADTGIGIPAEDIPTALSVFGQVKNRHEVDEEGTGLGLPLCKMLTELHGGKFHLESELGVGTKAIFTLPAIRVLLKKTKKTDPVVRDNVA